MSLVKRINLLCDEHNTTFAEVERKCELSNGSIRRWDKNTPSTDKLQKIAEYFNVSIDYLLYGFDKTELTALVNLVRHRRSIKELSNDTGIDEFYLNRLCSGVEYEQPTLDTILKIAINNENDWLVDAESLFNAAGYNLGEISGDLLEDIPLELLHHYQEQGMTESEMVIAYIKFRNAESKDQEEESNKKYLIDTVAAHLSSKNLNPEKLTPKKVKLLKQYIDTLFDEDEDE